MMNKNKQQLLVAKKQRLIRRIERQRQELAETSSDWLHTTAPYDRAWQTLMTFRPLVIAATGLLSVYSLRKPQKILLLGRKAITIWGLVRSIQSAIQTSKK
ncbi:YqjK-like family protein [Providencia sp. SP181]|uniref:YqjK-like family protein n=1 Tax=Providencia sp. SP181 TaxID=3136277 RepID=UPI003D272209